MARAGARVRQVRAGRSVGAQERVWAEASGWRAGGGLTQASRHWSRARAQMWVSPGRGDHDGAALVAQELERVDARAQEELRWRVSARDVGTQWPYRGRELARS
jgi:hypothetical protein